MEDRKWKEVRFWGSILLKTANVHTAYDGQINPLNLIYTFCPPFESKVIKTRWPETIKTSIQ